MHINVNNSKGMDLTTVNADSNVVGEYPNRISRRLLAKEWKTLSPERQLTVRAARSQRGICCTICGLAGYFRENCPNNCTSRPSTPDSLGSTPPLTPNIVNRVNSLGLTKPSSTGIFWGDSKDCSLVTNEKSSYQLKQKPDLTIVRQDAQLRLAELRETDMAPEGLFTFFTHSQHTYARTFAELSLQQVMRRLMRLLEKQLLSNADNLEAEFDTTLLHPPSDKVGTSFYPEELRNAKEFRDYFYQQSLKKHVDLNYNFQGNVRPIDDLDVLFRGNFHDKGELYKTKVNAGESIHAKNTWKSVLAKFDTLSDSDPTMARKQQKINQLFKNQSKWIEMQSKSMQYRNDRFEHLVNLLKSEIAKEHNREGLLLAASSKRAAKDLAMNVFQERLNSVDIIMKLLNSYKFSAGLEEADFLLFCLKNWRLETKHSIDNEKLKRREKDLLVEKARMSLTYGERFSPKTRKKITEQSQQRADKKDLVAAATHPYYQDQLFLERVTRKKERLYLSNGGKINQSKTSIAKNNLRAPPKHTLLTSYNSIESGDGDFQTPNSHQEIIISHEPLTSIESNRSNDIDNSTPTDQPMLDLTLNRHDPPVVMMTNSKRGVDSQNKPRTIKVLQKHPREIDAENVAKMKNSFRFDFACFYHLLVMLVYFQTRWVDQMDSKWKR
jgi:hypothetical protein